MYNIVQSVRVRGVAGNPIPTVFKNLEAIGVQLLRGQEILMASGPGVGKSAIALTLGTGSRASCLYFSADSDAFVQSSRAVAMLTGRTMGEATRIVKTGLSVEDTATLSGYPIRFRYNASPTLDDIETSMAAYEEVYGDYPELVIVDNLLDVMTSGTEENQFAGQQDILAFLNTLARETSACVVVLHHVTGGFNDADKPIPLSGVKGQLTQIPAVVLTIHRGGPDSIRVSNVKNRGGRADASGFTFAELRFNGDRMLIEDY